MIENNKIENKRNAGGRLPLFAYAIRIIGLTLAILLVGLGVSRGIATRSRAAFALANETRQMAIPAVSVVKPKRTSVREEIVLPGSIQAFVDAPIYARTSGYLKRWYVDIGTKVTTGQLLAEIDTPEIDEQLQQARADLSTAEANYHLAETTSARWQNLLETDSVSKQDAEQKMGDLQAKKAIMDSAKFNVDRFERLQAFQKIYAPFDGVITARNTDVGALIDAGSSGGPAKALFHLADTSKLRVFVNVPQIYSQSAVPGVRAQLLLSEFPKQRFAGMLVRTADAIDPGSRTLLAEIEVENTTGKLLPGAYTEVSLQLPSVTHGLVLPVNTLVFRSEGLRIATVNGGKATLVPIVLGKDFGAEVEVLSGLSGNESVIVNPPDSLVAGSEVHVSHTGAAGEGR